MALLDKVRQFTSKFDRNPEKQGIQILPPVSFNKPNFQPITKAIQSYQARPSNQIAKTIGTAFRPALEATGTFGNLAYQSIFNQPKLNRQMAIDTQKALDASNRALQAAKAAREAGRPDLAAQYTRSMIPQLQAQSNKFTQSAKEAEAKRNALISSGVRTALYTSAAARLPASIGAGAVGAGLNAAFGGQTSPEQIARSFGESFKYGGFPNLAYKGGLLARSLAGGAQNLAEDVAYAKLVEGRNLTPREAIISAATPGAFEAIGQFSRQVRKSMPKEVVEKVDPSGLMYNKAGQLFDPINGRWAKNTKEARLAAKNTKDFIASGGVPVKAGTRLVKLSDGKWVDESLIDQYKSEIDTPKLSVEPTPEQARANFQRQWQDAYGNRPATEKIDRPKRVIQAEKGATIDEMLRVEKEVNKSGKYFTNMGKVYDNATNRVIFDPSGKTTDEVVAFYKTLLSGENVPLNIGRSTPATKSLDYSKNPEYQKVESLSQPNYTKPLSVEPVGGTTDNANQFLSSVRAKFPDNNEKEMFDYAKKIADIRGSKQIDTQDIAEAVQYSRKVKGLGEDVGFNSLFSKDRTGTEILDRMKEVGVKDIDTSIYNVRDQVKNKLISLNKDTQSFVEAMARREGLVDVDGRISKRGLEILNNIIPGGKPTIQDIAKKMDAYKKAISPSPLGGKVGEVKKELTPAKVTDIPQLNKQLESIQAEPRALTPEIMTKQAPELQTSQTLRTLKGKDQSLDTIISEARKQIGTTPEPKDKSVKQVMDDLYTQWVSRYNPIEEASIRAKKTLKTKGAELRPEFDPEYLVRRLTGAGGIADQRFKTELNPIIKEMESLNIPKSDMDVYLANKRIAGFGKAGRDIYGADPKKAQEVVAAIESKYGNIQGIAQKMYDYQNKGFQEMVDAGFISPEAAQTIKSQNPDYAPLYRVMDEMDEYLGLPTRKTMQGTQPISKLKGSTRQIESPVESIIGNTFKQRAAIEKNRVAQSIVGLQNIADMGFTKASKASPETITVWNNGKKEYWNVGKDIAETAKGQNEEQMNLLLKVLQAPASLLRQGATGRNPEFLLPNIIRDQLDAGITSKYGYIPFVDFTSGLISMAKNDDVYKKWANSGAKIDLGEISGKKSIQELFNSKVEKKKLSTWLSQGLDVLGTLSEQPTRVGLFKKAYKKTGNELIAMMESRDATVDFARMGSKMKVANSIIPFLNVGVQGFDKLIRAVKNNPGRVALNAGIYGALPAIMTTLYNLNKDPEAYAEIPQYEKDSNFILVIGRNKNGTVDYLTFPKGNVIPTIANPIESFLAFTRNEDPEAFKQMLTQTLTSTLPVVGDGATAGEVATKTIGGLIPQGIKPLAENLLNKSFYKYDPKKEQSKEIVPYYMQNKPAYQQTYDFTPQMYQKIGAVFNASPLKVKNLMEGYLAGYTKIPSQIVEMMYKTSRGEEISPNEKTLMRRFIKQTYPNSGKEPEVKPEVPGLMERVTGKVGAAETAPVKEIKYKRASDNSSQTIKLSDLQKPTVTTLKDYLSSGNRESTIREIYKGYATGAIKEADMQSAFKTAGITVKEAEDMVIKELPLAQKSSLVYDRLVSPTSTTKDLDSMVESKLLTTNVITELTDSGKITEEQSKALKNYLKQKSGKVSKGKKPKKFKPTKFKPIKLKGAKKTYLKQKKLTLKDLLRK